MIKDQKIGWVRIAGSAEAIAKKHPPYWRFTTGLSTPPQQEFVDEVRVTGNADGMNMRDGMEIGANFLLWFQMYGTFSVALESGRRVLVIELMPSPTLLQEKPTKSVQKIFGNIYVYGAPDLARAGSTDRWRCVVQGREFIVQGMRICGNVTPGTFCTMEDVSPGNTAKYRHQWLSFTGQFSTDSNGDAVIELS